MVARKPNDKNTKAEILQAYNDLAKEKAALKSELDQTLKKQPAISPAQPALEVKPVMNKSQSAQQNMNYIIESLAKIQLGFGSAVSELSEQLSTEASKLAEIRQSVATEIQQLKQLHNLDIEADTLDKLIQTYTDNAKAYQEEFAQDHETRSQAINEQIKSWNKEQEESQKSRKERDHNLKKEQQRTAATYKYDLELSRKLATDEYEQQQQQLHKQLAEFRQDLEQQWTEKEKSISEREKEFNEAKAKVEAFPQEKETAIKKATEQGKGIANSQAKVKSDLYQKEVEGQKRFYEQRLQSLEQNIQNQESRIQNLSKQLESALKQVQDLAVKAIEGNSNASSYQAMKELAMEQAKNQKMNK